MEFLVVASAVALTLVVWGFCATRPSLRKNKGFHATMAATLAFVVVVTWAASTGGDGPSVLRVVLLGMALLHLVMGLALPSAPRNGLYGYRTPATLKSDYVWRVTHRFAGRMNLGVAAWYLSAAAFGVPFGWAVTVGTLGALAPILYPTFSRGG